MGSGNGFFSKFASIDPVAQILDLPGAHKYAQNQAQDVQTNAGPYAGQTPTLAAANAGYAPGSTAQGAQVGWTPNQATGSTGLFGKLQGIANAAGNTSPYTATMPGFAKSAAGVQANSTSTGNPYVQQSTTQNPYVTAAQRATVQPANQTWGG